MILVGDGAAIHSRSWGCRISSASDAGCTAVLRTFGLAARFMKWAAAGPSWPALGLDYGAGCVVKVTQFPTGEIGSIALTMGLNHSGEHNEPAAGAAQRTTVQHVIPAPPHAVGVCAASPNTA